MLRLDTCIESINRFYTLCEFVSKFFVTDINVSNLKNKNRARQYTENGYWPGQYDIIPNIDIESKSIRAIYRNIAIRYNKHNAIT